MAIILTLALCACGEDSETSSNASSEASPKAEKSIVGKYMIYSMEDNGEVIDYSTIVMIELDDSYVEFREDKTFTMALSGEEPDNGTYDADKLEIYDDEGVGISFDSYIEAKGEVLNI